MVAVYPGGVLGPHDPNIGPTTRAVVYWLTTPIPVTDGGMEIVDVRDIAAAVVAATEPGRGPRRLVLGGHLLDMAQIADLVEEISGATVRRIRMSARLLRGWGRLNDLLMRVVPATFTITHEGMVYLTKVVPSDDGDARRAGHDVAPGPRNRGRHHALAGGCGARGCGQSTGSQPTNAVTQGRR